MLNTSLHNPSVKDKLTVEKFVSMNRGIDGGKDLPPELLTVSKLNITFQTPSFVAHCISFIYKLVPKRCSIRKVFYFKLVSKMFHHWRFYISTILNN